MIMKRKLTSDRRIRAVFPVLLSAFCLLSVLLLTACGDKFAELCDFVTANGKYFEDKDYYAVMSDNGDYTLAALYYPQDKELVLGVTANGQNTEMFMLTVGGISEDYVASYVVGRGDNMFAGTAAVHAATSMCDTVFSTAGTPDEEATTRAQLLLSVLLSRADNELFAESGVHLSDLGFPT